MLKKYFVEAMVWVVTLTMIWTGYWTTLEMHECKAIATEVVESNATRHHGMVNYVHEYGIIRVELGYFYVDDIFSGRAHWDEKWIPDEGGYYFRVYVE